MSLLPNLLLSQSAPRVRSSTLRLLVIFSGLLLLIPLLGGLYLGLRTPQIEHETFESLSTIAQLNANQIENWLDERKADLEVTTGRSDFRERMLKLQQNGDPGDRKTLTDELDAVRNAYHYTSVALFDTKGNTLINVGDAMPEADERKALLSRVTTSGGVEHSRLASISDGEPIMFFFAPLFQTESESAGDHTPIGFFVTCVSLKKLVFPYLERWPTRSPTGETLLVQRNEDDVVFLNTPRHSNAAPHPLRVPLSRTALPAVRAVLNQSAGVMSGRDYRDIPVLAAYRPIAETS